MTNTDKLFESLKLLGIDTSPTDVSGVTAWYFQGEYLGTHSVEDGLARLQDIIKRVERA